MIRTILFDLDETLYARSTGVMEQIRTRILRYLQERLKLSAEEAVALQRHYHQLYGTTMRGLQLNHHIDAEEYLRYVHNIPLHKYIRPNPELAAVLTSLPQQKVVFTNASREHAEKILTLLGIRRHIARIVDVRDLGYESKPQPAAYQRICLILGVRPEECMLVEDNVRNLQPAKALGMTTVLVDGDTPDDSVDFAIERIEDIGRVFKNAKRKM